VLKKNNQPIKLKNNNQKYRTQRKKKPKKPDEKLEKLFGLVRFQFQKVETKWNWTKPVQPNLNRERKKQYKYILSLTIFTCHFIYNRD
jgi:hypothetical protein